MDNTVGSSSSNFCNFFNCVKDAYILGLWCADGYHRTSSIGLSSIDYSAIKKFTEFLSGLFDLSRLRLRVYHPGIKIKNFILPIKLNSDKISHLISGKSRHLAFHVYVNCRPLLREFQKAKMFSKNFSRSQYGWAYLAGRFDGDGSINKNLRDDLRIVYSNQGDIEMDYQLAKNLGLNKAKIYRYKSANTYCLYISRLESEYFLKNIRPYSIKLQKLELEPRRDFSHKRVMARMANNIEKILDRHKTLAPDKMSG